MIGHQNPDTDSICSAIAYAALKTALGEPGFVPARCGNSNARIDRVLSRFGYPLPVYLSDVTPRVRDLMVTDPVAVQEGTTCAEVLELFDRLSARLLPVVDDRRRVKGTVSLAHLGGIFIPRMSEPRLMRQVHSTLRNIARALKARVDHLIDGEREEELYVRLGTMDFCSFWKVSEREGIPTKHALIIVGDRADIQLKAIELGLRGIILSGGASMEPEMLRRARSRGVSVLVSPYDSAITALIVRTASSIGPVVDRNISSVGPDARLSDVRPRIAELAAPALPVTDAEGRLVGVLSKGDLLRPVGTRLVLVDHNEVSQSVMGAEEVSITEIIDHHRLGAPSTPAPIRFINEPVGSTCTIIAEMFRGSGAALTPAVAGLMMSGLIADTLLLRSPTSTPRDAEILAWLAKVAGEDPHALAEMIFQADSTLQSSPPAAVVRADQKTYAERGVRFAVSQVEELGFGPFWERAGPLAAALQDLVRAERLHFAALLVTDINTNNSLLLIRGDQELIGRISFPSVRKGEVFELPGIVSRKKQLLPYLTALLE